MSFNIIEKNIISKENNPNLCEDRIVHNEHFACVIDGVTSKSNILYNNKKSGLIVGEILEKIILNLNKKSNYKDVINKLTESIFNFYVQNNILENVKNNPLNRLSASMIIYSNYYKQIWMIGDCQALVDNKLYTNNKLIDTILSNTRAFYITKELLEGKSVDDLLNYDTGREYIYPLLKAQTYFQNNRFESEYSYSVIDGFPINLSQIKVIDVKDAKYIVLASDGYPKIFKDLIETEKYLHYVLNEDPLCYKLCKSTKGKKKNNISYDDRAYLKIKIK